MFAKRRLILTLWRINTRKLHVYADMENLIKQGFIKYAKTKQAEHDWDFAAEMFAKLLLNSARYFWSATNKSRLNKFLPIGERCWQSPNDKFSGCLK